MKNSCGDMDWGKWWLCQVQEREIDEDQEYWDITLHKQEIQFPNKSLHWFVMNNMAFVEGDGGIPFNCTDLVVFFY